VMLTLRRREGTRKQNPGDQSRVRAADRMRLVDMPSERRIDTGARQAPGPSGEGEGRP
jgi:NADH-quinone oxidoreductase subunit J